ncbi:MAG: class I SAM-dependent methyltransferase [Rectinemataceae bacterium]|nr:class I SAM-dependent methyltransferase [Spirochaetaceae bacterium]
MSGIEWFEDESFWDAFAPFMFDEVRWDLADEEIAHTLALAGISEPARVLDLCCGVGRHSLALARRGHAVTGVDLMASLLEAARESAAAQELNVEFVQADARSYTGGPFDLCINLGASFGYFRNREDDLAMLARCYANLVPGGVLVLETLGKESTALHFREAEAFEYEGWQVSARYSIEGPWEALGNLWSAEKDTQHYERWFTLRLYSAYELGLALEKAGFGNVAFFGGLDGRPYDQTAEMLVAVARA